LERISDAHLEAIRNFLKRGTKVLDVMREAVLKHYRWNDLPNPVRGNVYGVDGSRMSRRLTGAIIYAVSSYAFGRDPYWWTDIGVLYPYSNAEDRVRVHMEILEKRIGAMAYELGGELILMDGTLSGALVRPPTYADSTTRELYNQHGKKLFETAVDFLQFLDKWWERWRRELKKTKFISSPSLLSRGLGDKDIFTLLMENRSKPILQSLWWISDVEDLIVLFEYLEYLHALDRLFGCETGAIAKTFYKREVVGKTYEMEKENLKKKLGSRELLNVASMIVDTPVVSTLTFRRGYLKFDYAKGPKSAISHLVVDLMREEFFQNLRDILVLEENKILGVKIKPAYVRFADGGLVYLLEVPEGQDFEETLAKIVAVAGDEYIIPLEMAHKSVVITLGEFTGYVNSILSSLVGEDESYLNFLRYGREPLE